MTIDDNDGKAAKKNIMCLMYIILRTRTIEYVDVLLFYLKTMLCMPITGGAIVLGNSRRIYRSILLFFMMFDCIKSRRFY